MEAKDQEFKAFALSRLMAGTSYRDTQAAVQETFGQSVALSTLNAWVNEDPGQAQAIGQAHLRSIAHQRVRIAHKAGEMLEEAIDSGAIPAGQRAVTYGIASDKVDSMIKIGRDERRKDDLVQQYRQLINESGIPIDELEQTYLLDKDDPRVAEINERWGIDKASLDAKVRERYHHAHPD